MKSKILMFACLMVTVTLLFAVGASAAEIVDSGMCGDNVAWELNEFGTLSISGEGDMWNWDGEETFAPWTEMYMGYITRVVIEDGVTSIGDCAFFMCFYLEETVIPDSVTYIGEWAFMNCESLTEMTVPAGVKRVGYAPFGGCLSLTEIGVAEGNTNFTSVDGVLYSMDQMGLYQYPAGKEDAEFTVPALVENVYHGAFSYAVCLERVAFPEEGGLVWIGECAFQYCMSLSEVDFGNRVQVIMDGAFADCEALVSVTLPQSLRSLGTGVFQSCYSLEEILVDEAGEGADPSYISVDGVLFSGDGKILVQYPMGNPRTEYAIPEGTASIESYAFSSSLYLTTVTVPESVTSIGTYAFSGGQALEEMVIPAGASVITEGAFTLCTALRSVKLSDGIVEIGKGAFMGCVSLTEIDIPESVTAIGDMSFALSGLVEITVPGSVNAIGYGVFTMCGALTDVTLSDGVQVIGDSAFLMCTSLTNVSMADSVTEIGKAAFSISGLTAVTIPKNVVSIGADAFSMCTKLEELTVLSQNVTFGKDAFSYVSDTMTVCGYEGSTAANFASANGFAFRELLPETPEELLGDINGDGIVNITDAVKLFQYSMLPESYPISYSGSVDFTEDGVVDFQDALKLFRYSTLPEIYPLV